MKIEHIAYITGSPAATQYMTHYFTWTKNSSLQATGLSVTTIENNRIPLNKAIVDPKTVTGSFDSNGNIELEAYHYSPRAQHNFRYIVL
jgi:hypothetical protein